MKNLNGANSNGQQYFEPRIKNLGTDFSQNALKKILEIF
jgi:hypothetical protein